MRPVRLEISGLRSFRAAQTIDFSDMDLFAVVGDTGSGKSSILEAMIYALYNACSWSERDVHDLVASDCDTMKVVFDFTTSGHTYRVTRARSKVAGRAAVHALRSDSDPSASVDGERAVNAALRRIVGLDYSAFCKTVILPQGRFAELLLAKDAERQRILGDLLRLDEIERLRELLEPSREEVRALRSRLDGARAELGSDLAGRRDAALAESADADAEVQRFEATSVKLRETVPRLTEILEESTAAKSRDQILGLFSEPIAALEELRGQQTPLAQSVATAQARWESAREAAAQTTLRVEALRDRGREAAELARQRELLRRAYNLSLDLRADTEQSAARESKLASERHAIDEAIRARTSLITQRDEAESVLRRVRETHAGAQEELRRASREWQLLGAQRASAADADRRSRLGAAREKDALLRVGAAQSAADDAHERAKRARRAFDEARSTSMLAELARGLRDGEPCPLCVRPLPEGFRPPRGPDLEPLASALADAERDRDTALQTLASAKASAQAAAAARAEANAVSEEQRRGLHQAEAAVRAVGIDPSAPDEAAATAALRDREAVLTEELTRAAEHRDAARSAVDRASASIEVRSRAYDADITAHAAASRRVAERRTEWNELHASLWPEHRLPLEAEESDLRRTETVLAVAIADAKRVEDESRAAVLEHQATERALHDAEAVYRREITDPVVAARARLEHALAQMEAVPLKAPIPTPPVRSGDGFDASMAWCEQLERWAEEARQRLADESERLVRDAATLRAERLELLRPHRVDTEEAFEAARRGAHARAGAAVTRSRALEDAVCRAAQLDAEREALAPLERALDILGRYLSARSFKEWLMRRRESTLLGLGTEILRTMTRGRYAFAARFRIFDSHSGLERSPHTLSGGERFLGSLALALALVEVTARSGGRVESMFLDEGFGTLDAAALDEALGELATRASGGHLIGIVTHVRGVAEIIETILRVRREASGTVVERLNAADRNAYLEDELAAGLLGAAADRAEGR